MRKTLFHISAFLLLIPATCFAAPGVFTTFPSHTLAGDKWIVRDVNPGHNYQEGITVENLQDSPISLSLQVIESSGDKKNIRLLENQAFQNIGNWISPEESLIKLSAHQKKEIKLNISVPSTTQLGEYQAVILATNTSHDPKGINIATRIGNRIYLNVTNAGVLQTNTFNTNVSSVQILIMLFATGAIIYGLPSLKKAPTKNQLL